MKISSFWSMRSVNRRWISFPNTSSNRLSGLTAAVSRSASSATAASTIWSKKSWSASLKSVPKRSLMTWMSCDSGAASSRAAPPPTSVGPSRARAASPSPSGIEPSLIFCRR